MNFYLHRERESCCSSRYLLSSPYRRGTLGLLIIYKKSTHTHTHPEIKRGRNFFYCYCKKISLQKFFSENHSSKFSMCRHFREFFFYFSSVIAVLRLRRSLIYAYKPSSFIMHAQGGGDVATDSYGLPERWQILLHI